MAMIDSLYKELARTHDVSRQFRKLETLYAAQPTWLVIAPPRALGNRSACGKTPLSPVLLRFPLVDRATGLVTRPWQQWSRSPPGTGKAGPMPAE